MKYDQLNNVSNEAVQKATGKSWAQWVALLDRAGAANLTHADIASYLAEKKLIRNSWWCQMVTVGYEYAKGRRVRGETASQGFEVGVQKTVPLSRKAAWRLLMSRPAVELWLGKGILGALKPGRKFSIAAGRGEVRTVKAGERIRLAWQPKGRAKPTTVQLTVGTTSHGAVHLHVHQEKLRSQAERERMRRHWQRVLEQISRLAE